MGNLSSPWKKSVITILISGVECSSLGTSSALPPVTLKSVSVCLVHRRRRVCGQVSYGLINIILRGFSSFVQVVGCWATLYVSLSSKEAMYRLFFSFLLFRVELDMVQRHKGCGRTAMIHATLELFPTRPTWMEPPKLPERVEEEARRLVSNPVNAYLRVPAPDLTTPVQRRAQDEESPKSICSKPKLILARLPERSRRVSRSRRTTTTINSITARMLRRYMMRIERSLIRTKVVSSSKLSLR